MRTLFEITNDISDGIKPSYEEIFYSLLVYKALHYFDHADLYRIYEKPDAKIFGIEWTVNESHKRFKKWLDQDPKITIGWENDPENKDYLSRVKIEKNFFDKFMANRNEE
jgi:hypothetical protein